MLAHVAPMLASVGLRRVEVGTEVGQRSGRGRHGVGRLQGASSHVTFGNQPKASGKDTGCGPVTGARN